MDRQYLPAVAGLASVVVVGSVMFWMTRATGPELAEVTGVVTLDGKPLDTVEVPFLPDPGAGTRGPTAACYTDESGRFRLRVGRPDADGAVLGVHRVTFVDITTLPYVGGDDGGSPRRATSRVPKAYQNPLTTPLSRVEVRPGANAYEFVLRSDRR